MAAAESLGILFGGAKIACAVCRIIGEADEADLAGRAWIAIGIADRCRRSFGDAPDAAGLLEPVLGCDADPWRSLGRAIIFIE